MSKATKAAKPNSRPRCYCCNRVLSKRDRHATLAGLVCGDCKECIELDAEKRDRKLREGAK